MSVGSGAGASAAAANATTGFMETHGAGVCRGRYARALAREWAAWDKRCDNGMVLGFAKASGAVSSFIMRQSMQWVRCVAPQTCELRGSICHPA